ASITSPVRTFMPNDFGLYNMGGNVAEWTMDLYRPLTSITLRDVEQQDLNPYRGGQFQSLVMDENGKPVEKDSIGRLRYRYVEDDEVANRENYKRGKVYDYLDGDSLSQVTYNYGVSTLVSDKARVIKGGSWADRAYWMSPGARRFKEEDKSSRTLGFRCSMTRTGGSAGNEDTGGNVFKGTGKKTKRRYK
ncbi:MAG: SUMF1/EgtB/PvdO family nonheme iron enzyme, partial [Saprospiraceae bacterium]